MVRAGEFQVLLTDLRMTEGLESIQTIRREQPKLKIVAISGALGGTLPSLAEKLGVDASVMKPVSPDVLLAAVRRVLG
jgi:DNA-binding NarL/FixJ family response regulator